MDLKYLFDNKIKIDLFLENKVEDILITYHTTCYYSKNNDQYIIKTTKFNNSNTIYSFVFYIHSEYAYEEFEKIYNDIIKSFNTDTKEKLLEEINYESKFTKEKI